MTTVITGRPESTEYAPHYEAYVSKVPAGDVLAFLAGQASVVSATFAGMPGARAAHRYADDKWSVREVLGHIIDAERVFAYRALAFARGEGAALPAFDENAYARSSGHDTVPLEELVEEFEALRRANLLLFRHLPAESWRKTGVASGKPVSVRALAFIIAGHAQHHLLILRDRYGVPLAS
ncbi:MAG: DinB family protein [Acidobacteriota bacterium]